MRENPSHKMGGYALIPICGVAGSVEARFMRRLLPLDVAGVSLFFWGGQKPSQATKPSGPVPLPCERPPCAWEPHVGAPVCTRRPGRSISDGWALCLRVDRGSGGGVGGGGCGRNGTFRNAKC